MVDPVKLTLEKLFPVIVVAEPLTERLVELYMLRISPGAVLLKVPTILLLFTVTELPAVRLLVLDINVTWLLEFILRLVNVLLLIFVDKREGPGQLINVTIAVLVTLLTIPLISLF